VSEVVCDREFGILVDGVQRRIVVEWMKPCRYKGDWRCDWVIYWPARDEQSRHAIGADSTQALLLAMKQVSMELSTASPPAFLYTPGDDLDLPAHEFGAAFAAPAAKDPS